MKKSNGLCHWCQCKIIAVKLLKVPYAVIDELVTWTVENVEQTAYKLTVDHLDPLGGNPTKNHNCRENLVAACRACNENRARTKAFVNLLKFKTIASKLR